MGYRSARRLIAALSLAVVVAAWLAAGLWLRRDFQETRQDGLDTLVRTSQLTAEHLRRLLSVADLALDNLEPALAAGQPPGAAWEVALRFVGVVGDADCLSLAAAIDHQGHTIRLSGTNEGEALPLPAALTAHASGNRISVGAPIRTPGDGRWMIPLVRRVNTPNHPIALLVAAIDVAALERMYDGFRRHQGGAIGLINLDGALLVRSPPWPGTLGLSLRDHPLFQRHAGHTKQLSVTTVSPVDGAARAVVFTMAEPYPVAAVVSMTDEELLAPWWGRVRLVLAFLGGATLVVLGGAALILGLLRRLAGEAQGLERRVETRTAELRRMIDRRRVFLASLSHELRSPLNVILGFSEALLTGLHGPLGAGARGYLSDIHRSGKLMLALVNDLLDGAAMEAGGLRLDFAPVDLADLVGEATTMIGQQAAAHGSTVSSRIEPAGLRLSADRRRLLQVLLNLGTNAVKYGGRDCRIEISARLTPDQGCRIEVTDSGPGMSEDEMAMALTPFGRADGSRGIEGTGLGLPLAAGLCALHDGRLTLHSRPGAGTRVEILLPPARVLPPSERTGRTPTGTSPAPWPMAEAAPAAAGND